MPVRLPLALQLIFNTPFPPMQTLHELKKRYHEKEERYKNLSSLDEMQQKLDVLKNQMAWALVRNFTAHHGFS